MTPRTGGRIRTGLHGLILATVGFFFFFSQPSAGMPSSSSDVGKSDFGLSATVSSEVELCAGQRQTMDSVALGFATAAVGIGLLVSWFVIFPSVRDWNFSLEPLKNESSEHKGVYTTLGFVCLLCVVVPLVTIAGLSEFRLASGKDAYLLLWVAGLILVVGFSVPVVQHLDYINILCAALCQCLLCGIIPLITFAVLWSQQPPTGACCQPGYYTNFTSIPSNTSHVDFECIACPAMHYCEDGVSAQACPADTTIPNTFTGLKTLEDCKRALRYNFIDGKLTSQFSLSAGILERFDFCESKSKSIYLGLFIAGFVLLCCFCGLTISKGSIKDEVTASAAATCLSMVLGVVFLVLYIKCEGVSCPRGQVASYIKRTESPSCTVRPAGYYVDNYSYSAIPCPAGKYDVFSYVVSSSPLTFATRDVNDTSLKNVCATCPHGRYSIGGETACKQCTASEQGIYLDLKVGNTLTVCGRRSCPTGHFCPVNDTQSFACPVGKYQNATGQGTCKSCPAGSTCANAGTVNPLPCPKGYYCPHTNASMIECPAGMYQNKTNQLRCKSCIAPDGYFCSSRSSSMIKRCPIGHYCPGNTTEAIPCEKGTFQNKTGQSTCELCPGKGYACNNTLGFGSTSAVPCPPGHYCINGTARKCGIGWYQNATLSSSCHLCPERHSCAVLGTADPPLCPQGFYCPLNQSGATLACPANQYQDELGQISCKSDCDTSNNHYIPKDKQRCSSCSGANEQDKYPLAHCPCPIGLSPSPKGTYCCPAMYSGDQCEDDTLVIVCSVLTVLVGAGLLYFVYKDCSMPDEILSVLIAVFFSMGDFASDIFYLTSSVFANAALYWLSLCAICIPSIVFMAMNPSVVWKHWCGAGKAWVGLVCDASEGRSSTETTFWRNMGTVLAGPASFVLSGGEQWVKQSQAWYTTWSEYFRKRSPKGSCMPHSLDLLFAKFVSFVLGLMAFLLVCLLLLLGMIVGILCSFALAIIAVTCAVVGIAILLVLWMSLPILFMAVYITFIILIVNVKLSATNTVSKIFGGEALDDKQKIYLYNTSLLAEVFFENTLQLCVVLLNTANGAEKDGIFWVTIGFSILNFLRPAYATILRITVARSEGGSFRDGLSMSMFHLERQDSGANITPTKSSI